MKLNNNKGVALVFTLFFVTILYIFQGIFVFNVINEARIAKAEREQTKTFILRMASGKWPLNKWIF